MKKSTIVIFCFIIVIVILGASYIGENLSGTTYVYKELTQQQALMEMPYVAITDEDFLLIQTISQDEDIKKALEDGQANEYIIKKGEELAREMLPEDIQPSTVHSSYVFSIGFDTINIDYADNGHRVIIALQENGTITKTVSKQPKNGKVKTMYSNIDNKEYQKCNVVPQFWYTIFKN